MLCLRPWFASRVARFEADERGVVSTEWVVAVAIVTLMAVPVLAVVGDGSQTSSEQVVVSITDTDSFGGEGFHPGDENRPAEDEEELYDPGADLGVAAPDQSHDWRGATAGGSSNSGSATPQRPRYFADFGNARRDKPSSASGSTSAGPGSSAGSGSTADQPEAEERPSIKIPKQTTRRLRTRAPHDCEVEVHASASSQNAPGSSRLLINSGR